MFSNAMVEERLRFHWNKCVMGQKIVKEEGMNPCGLVLKRTVGECYLSNAVNNRNRNRKRYIYIIKNARIETEII